MSWLDEPEPTAVSKRPLTPLTSPINDEMLEEQRQRAINKPSFIDRERLRQLGKKPRIGAPDGLYVSRVARDGGLRCTVLVDQEGCVISRSELAHLVEIASEGLDKVFEDDHEIEQYNLNARERVFMRWVEDNSGKPYDEVIASINKPRKRRRPRQPQEGYVYVIHGGGHHKIGRSRSPDKRLCDFNVTLPFECEIIQIIHSTDYVGLESGLHEEFADKHVNGEWFDLDEADLEYIKGLGVS